jgi:hypothetical protein
VTEGRGQFAITSAFGKPTIAAWWALEHFAFPGGRSPVPAYQPPGLLFYAPAAGLIPLIEPL